MAEDGSRGARATGDEDHSGELARRWRRPGGDMRTWHASIWEPPYPSILPDVDWHIRNAKIDMLAARIDAALSR